MNTVDQGRNCDLRHDTKTNQATNKIVIIFLRSVFDLRRQLFDYIVYDTAAD